MKEMDLNSKSGFKVPKLQASKRMHKDANMMCSTFKLMHVNGKLSVLQKGIVLDIGLSAIMDLCCSSVPKNLVVWLADRFDTETNTVNLPNGLSFEINAAVVNSILRIPMGPKKIVCSKDEEANQYIRGQFKSIGRTPTVDELVSVITPTLTGDKFARAYILLALSSFLCPNSKNVCSTKYFSAIISVTDIIQQDWCSLVLQWLNSSIQKYQKNKSNGQISPTGGCVLLLVVAYLEFLYSSEFNFRICSPRLKFWSTSVIQTFALLDAQPGSSIHFGRLPVKHLCCTPFKDCFRQQNYYSDFATDLETIIKENCRPEQFESVKTEISELSEKFQHSIAQKVMKDTSDYVHSVLSLISSKGQKEKEEHKGFFLEDSDSESEEEKHSDAHSHLQKKQKVQGIEFDSILGSFKALPEPEFRMELKFPNIVEQAISKVCSEILQVPNNSDLDTENDSYASFQMLISDLHELNYDDNIFNEQEVVDLITLAQSKCNEFVATKNRIPEEKVTMEWFIEHENEDIPIEKSTLVHDATTNFGIPSTSATFSKGPRYGLSLNEALLGPTIFKVDPQQNFPNFDIFAEELDDNPTICKNQAIPDTRGFNEGFQKSSNLMQNQDFIHVPRESTSRQYYTNQQIIFPTALENRFYSLLTHNISKITFSPRIFERDGIWVDQRTLSFSMMPGGWFHFRVMDCFCKLFSYQQVPQVDSHIYKIFFSNVTTTVLMEHSLDHTKYKTDFIKIKGVDPENCGLVHIPCFIDKQWVLVVANFIKKRFDVLSPEHGADRTMKVIHSVIYNFRNFFILAFPLFQKFNIRDFPVTYINVPKQQFKEDSGIFVTCFMETFDGSTIAKFSNADVQALREKKLFQLIFSKENKAKPEIVTNFSRQYNIGFFYVTQFSVSV